ncbi:MAG: flagellar motor switch protein FliG [Gammaproteobacteria bacterium]|nr:flagellar motor switch protein FliG [Gammaproteobacteria bacterium]
MVHNGTRGVERAAILLMSLGEQAASEVMKHMAPREIKKVGAAMADLENVSREQVENVLNHFCETMQNETGLGLGTDVYLRNVLTKALGPEHAGDVIDRILQGANNKGLETLRWMDARSVSELIAQEHPQIIAIVLSYLESEHSAEILTFFSEDVRVDVLMRIATLDGIQPAALNELNNILEKQLSSRENIKTTAVGGIKIAAKILNSLENSIESEVLDDINESDAKLGQEIQDMMFVFNDLISVADRDIQTILREISSESLVLSLKAADESLKNKITKNMSKRAALMLIEDIEARGPVRLSVVTDAQKDIITVVRRLALSGDISIGDSAREEYI